MAKPKTKRPAKRKAKVVRGWSLLNCGVPMVIRKTRKQAEACKFLVGDRLVRVTATCEVVDE